MVDNSNDTLESHASEKWQKIKNKAREIGDDISEKSDHIAKSARRKSEYTLQETSEHIHTWSDQLQHKIHKNPLISVVIAFVIGIIFSTIFMR